MRIARARTNSSKAHVKLNLLLALDNLVVAEGHMALHIDVQHPAFVFMTQHAWHHNWRAYSKRRDHALRIRLGHIDQMQPDILCIHTNHKCWHLDIESNYNTKCLKQLAVGCQNTCHVENREFLAPARCPQHVPIHMYINLQMYLSASLQKSLRSRYLIEVHMCSTWFFYLPRQGGRNVSQLGFLPQHFRLPCRAAKGAFDVVKLCVCHSYVRAWRERERETDRETDRARKREWSCGWERESERETEREREGGREREF